jgi:hypothetical protein
MSSPDSQTTIPGYLDYDAFALELGRLAASRLTEGSLQVFKGFVHRLEQGGSSEYAQAWLKAIDDGPEAVRSILTDTTDRGQALRSCVAFRAFVSKDERDRLLRDLLVPSKKR